MSTHPSGAARPSASEPTRQTTMVFVPLAPLSALTSHASWLAHLPSALVPSPEKAAASGAKSAGKQPQTVRTEANPEAENSSFGEEGAGSIRKRAEHKINEAEHKINEAERQISEIERKVIHSLRKLKRPYESFKKTAQGKQGHAKRSAEKDGGGCAPNSRGRRGDNVRCNPAMQKTARDGQRYWHDKVKELRTDFDQARTAMTHNHFPEQRFMCSGMRSKQERFVLLCELCPSDMTSLVL